MSTDIAPGTTTPAEPTNVPSVLRRALVTQWVMLLLTLSAATAYVSYVIVEQHRETDASERRHLLTQARAIATNLNEQLASTQRALSEVRGATSGTTQGARNQQLKTLVNILRGVRTINVLDRNGITIASNRDELLGRDFSAREYFKAAKALANPDGMVLSTPFKTVLGAWGLNVALPLRGPGNEFAGIVSATLDQDYFHTLLASVQYAPDMRLIVVHGDGVLFAVVPRREDLEGKNLAQPGAFFTQQVQSGRSENVFSGTVYSTGENRIGAMVTVRAAQADHFLVAGASRNVDAIFDGWQRDAINHVVLLLALIITSITGLTLFQRRQFAAAKQDALATDQLRQSEARLRAIIEASPVPFALNDAQQNITYLNAAFTCTYGYNTHDIPTLAEWWPRAYPDAAYRQQVMSTWAEHLHTAQREHKPFAPMEIDIQCKDGAVRTAWAVATPLGESFASDHLVVLYDITERKAAEAQREQLQAQLRQAQKMEAVGQLTGGIAHDFNNILATILGYADLLREQLPQTADGKAARHLDQIQRAGERARDLIAKMLAFARGTTGEPRALDPRAAIREIIHMMGPTLSPAIKIEIDIDAEIPSIRADLVQLHQIVANLLINARDALPGTGSIRVGMYRASAQDATCNACGEFFSGEFFTLAVNDNGSGIAPERLPHIFNPFYTTKEVSKGTGLGLSVVHGIVHELGGHILVDSNADSGTTFRVLFPVMPAQEESDAA